METREDPRREPLTLSGKRYIIRDHFAVVVHLALLLGAARSLGWRNAWVLAGVMLAIKTSSALVNLRVNPAVLNARGTKRDMSPRERAFFLVFIPASLAIPIVAGLDVGRDGWTHQSSLELAIGLTMMVAGGTITIWALAVNAFFEPTVRIQDDRGQQVCSSGPYRYVRHPGYLGAMLVIFAVPLLLGSRWCFLPVAIESIALIVRIAYEDRMLHADLPGYVEYAATTRYRLIPLLW